jgi:hypothetical protein
MDNNLSWDKIISYIDKKIVPFEYENNPKDIIDSPEKPKVSKKILSNLGISKEDFQINEVVQQNKNHNISFFASVLFCIKEDYLNLEKNDQILYIYQMRDIMIASLTQEKLFTKMKYRSLGWRRKDITNELKTFGNDTKVIRFFSDYFNINIFIVNKDTNKIYAVYKEELFNPFKCTIFVVLEDDIYSPVILNKEKVVSFTNTCLSSLLLKQSFEALSCTRKPTEKTFNMFSGDTNYFNEYYGNEINEDPEYELDIGETEYVEYIKPTEDIFLKEGDIKKKNKKTIPDVNDGMTLKKLREISQQFDIEITKGVTKTGKPKMKTKAQLISEIRELE